MMAKSGADRLLVLPGEVPGAGKRKAASAVLAPDNPAIAEYRTLAILYPRATSRFAPWNPGSRPFYLLPGLFAMLGVPAQ